MAVIVLFCGSSAAAEQVSPAAPFVELRPGVVIDSTRGAIYVGQPKGGVEGIELQTGRSLWTSQAADFPLALGNGALVALHEETRPGAGLPIAAFDVADGGKTLWSLTAPLPPGVIALVTDTLHRSFRATAKVENTHVIVSWTYRGAPVLGATRAPGQSQEELKLAGAVRIDLVGGRIIETRDMPPDAAAPPPTGLAARLMETNQLPQPPSRAGNVLAATLGGRRAPVILKRWNAGTGAPLPDVVLVKDGLFAMPSSDSRYVLASERVGQGGPDDPEYRWSVFSQETGQRVGQLRRDTSSAPFFVSERSVIFESQPSGVLQGTTWVTRPLEIVAASFTTGRQIWSHAIRDVDYRGAAPPK